MYELKCPSCGHAIESSFVRVGAVVVCESCEQTYRVAQAHVTRRVRVSSGKSSEGGSSDPLLSEGGGASADGSAPAALAGAAVDDEPVQGEPVAGEGDDDGEPRRVLAGPDAGHSTQRAALLLIAGLGGILAAMAMVYWLTLNAPAGEAPTQRDAPEAIDDADDADDAATPADDPPDARPGADAAADATAPADDQ